ncbi:hypothetical protein D3C73_1068580 [compost metagenome]
MTFHGPDRHHELLGNLAVGQSGDGQGHDVLLTSGQRHGSVRLGVRIMNQGVTQAGLADIAQNRCLPRLRAFAFGIKRHSGFVERYRGRSGHSGCCQEVARIHESLALAAQLCRCERLPAACPASGHR